MFGFVCLFFLIHLFNLCVLFSYIMQSASSIEAGYCPEEGVGVYKWSSALVQAGHIVGNELRKQIEFYSNLKTLLFIS